MTSARRQAGSALGTSGCPSVVEPPAEDSSLGAVGAVEPPHDAASTMLLMHARRLALVGLRPSIARRPTTLVG
jgi:hypothetical protein